MVLLILLVSLCAASPTASQNWPVQAGVGIPGFSGDGGPATEAKLAVPSGVFIDADGNTVISDTANDRIRVIGIDGTIRTIAGTGERATTGDGGPASDASLSSPTAVFVDGAGSIYFSEWTGHRIRKISPTGTITTVAGTGSHGFGGDGKPGTETNLWSPSAIYLDGDHNLYIAEWDNHRIRKVASDGTVSSLAGTGLPGLSADGTAASKARISRPNGIFVAQDGTVYFSEVGNQRIRRITQNGILETVVGTGSSAFGGDGGPATDASIENPSGLFIDAGGNLFFSDSGNSRIRKIAPDGTITTVVGGAPFGQVDAEDPTELPLHAPNAIFVDRQGDLLVVEGSGHWIRRFPGFAAPTELPAAKPKSSDFDGDLVVGFLDFLLFTEQFGRSSADATFDARFDLFEDGTIGFVDFLRFARAFGTRTDQ